MPELFDDPNLNSIIIRPRRVFSCKNCKRTAQRKDVDSRVVEGKKEYFCRWCGGKVEDTTNTETGRNFIQILNL